MNRTGRRPVGEKRITFTESKDAAALPIIGNNLMAGSVF